MDLYNTNIEALNYRDLKQTFYNSSSQLNYPMHSGAIANDSRLTKITLPASCSQFGLNYSYYSDAFANCTSLQNFNNFTLKTTSSEDANGNQTQTLIIGYIP